MQQPYNSLQRPKLVRENDSRVAVPPTSEAVSKVDRSELPDQPQKIRTVQSCWGQIRSAPRKIQRTMQVILIVSV